MEKQWLEGRTFLGGTVNTFEIITNQEAVVLHGSRDDASDQILTGRVRLDLKDSISGRIRLRFSRKIRHRQRVQGAGDPYSSTATLVEFVYNASDLGNELLNAEAGKLSAGSHEYPFSFTIPADSPASLEGPAYTYIIYRLKCTVERGVFSKDLIIKKHVRVHRTFSPDTLALQYPVCTDSNWPDKCAYEILTPRKGIIYGTKIPMQYRISPMKKGVRPSRVKCQLEQRTVINTCSDLSVGTRRNQKRETSKIVCEDTTMLDENIEQGEDGWYSFSNTINLLNQLSKVVQTYKEPTVPDLEVKHFVHYQVGLLNPEGHMSEIQGEMGVILFFTRQMHVDDDSVIGQPETDAEVEAEVPPDYQHSRLDRLYDEVSHSGYATPLPRSGAATPRVLSTGNLQALLEDREEDEGANQRGEESADENDDASHEAHANTLRNRLDEIVNPVSNPNGSAAVQVSSISNGDRGTTSLSFSHVSSMNRTGHPSSPSPMSRTPAQDVTDAMEQAPTGAHVAAPSGQDSNGSPQRMSPIASAQLTRQNSPVHIEALSRVPSYDTALRTPAPPDPQQAATSGSTLPTYEVASRQNSVDDSINNVAHAVIGSSSRRPGVLSAFLHRR